MNLSTVSHDATQVGQVAKRDLKFRPQTRFRVDSATATLAPGTRRYCYQLPTANHCRHCHWHLPLPTTDHCPCSYPRTAWNLELELFQG
jgi:hypothetical protein